MHMVIWYTTLDISNSKLENNLSFGDGLVGKITDPPIFCVRPMLYVHSISLICRHMLYVHSDIIYEKYSNQISYSFDDIEYPSNSNYNFTTQTNQSQVVINSTPTQSYLLLYSLCIN